MKGMLLNIKTFRI